LQVTCRLPLLRLVVPISDGLTPGPAVGLPRVSRGGQSLAPRQGQHDEQAGSRPWPNQVAFSALSMSHFTHRLILLSLVPRDEEAGGLRLESVIRSWVGAVGR
jgi:hypothetical protein